MINKRDDEKTIYFFLVFLFPCFLFGGEFHDAVKRNDFGVILKFVNAGVDVDLQDKDGLTPLHLASFYGKIEVASLLIKHKANVNAKDKNGRTPLHGASFSGTTELVSFLIKHKANVNVKDKDGRTPLHGASFSIETKISSLLILIKHKANVNAKDKDGLTSASSGFILWKNRSGLSSY